MADLLFIQEYYYYLIVFIWILIFVSVESYSKDKLWTLIIPLFVFPFSFFLVYYIGSRDVNIGVDTVRYESRFRFYESRQDFIIVKDPFYDFLNYLFSKTFGFQALLFFCAFIYIFGALLALRKIFKDNFFLPFLIFLISPYFINSGINVMRSGVAASLFLVGLAVYYKRGRDWKGTLWFIGSILFHASMFVPLFSFFITRYFRDTKKIFLMWLASIALAIAKVNLFTQAIRILELFSDRAGGYAQKGAGDESSWSNFAIFGFFPVIFAIYNLVVLKYKNEFYKWLVNAYMLIHIPYILLIHTQFASRLGYLAEFMMPVILLIPLLVNPVMKIKFVRLKTSLIIFVVFMIKAYKILII